MTPITTAKTTAKQVRADSRNDIVAQEVNDGDRCGACEHKEVARAQQQVLKEMNFDFDSGKKAYSSLSLDYPCAAPGLLYRGVLL